MPIILPKYVFFSIPQTQFWELQYKYDILYELDCKFDYCCNTMFNLMNIWSRLFISEIWSFCNSGFNVLTLSSSPAAWGLLWLTWFSSLGRRGHFMQVMAADWRWWPSILDLNKHFSSHTLSKKQLFTVH